jgi:hypothetical protein
MAQKKPRPSLQKLPEPRQVPPGLQANADRFVRAVGHLILVKVNPEAARLMAKEQIQ